jgi:pimeloyl-ACP methyl ester carboxylesterase
MLKLLNKLLVVCVLLGVFSIIQVQAQGTAVEATAPDGLTLKGDFYLVDVNRPTVLLLHELYTSRTSWQPYIGTLTSAGYNVLAVDLRGMGQTRGKQNWTAAVGDVAVWMNWLRMTAGVRGDAISTMGSSIGSSLAIVGCAQDAACKTAVALSPGWNANGISVEAALTTQLPGRRILIVYSQRDRFPALGVPRMVAAAPDVITLQTYPGNAHGMKMLQKEVATAMPVIMAWLAANGG